MFGKNAEMTVTVKTNNGKPEVAINGTTLVNLQESLLKGDDIDLPVRRTEKHDGKKIAGGAVGVFIVGVVTGAIVTYYMKRTPGCESPEAMCEAANPGQLAVYYGQNNFSPDQGFVQPVMNYVGKWACATFVCGLANLAGNLGGVFKALNSTTPGVIARIETDCNRTMNNESFAQCFVTGISDVAGRVKEVCQYGLFGQRNAFNEIELDVTSGNFTTTSAKVQKISP